MKNTHHTTQSIHELLLQHVAPLPSQAEYARNLASIFSMHIHRNELMDDGLSADELPAPSAIVVAPTGQGKTFLLRKMAQHLGLNVIIIDCSSLAAEGWKGASLSQRLEASMKELKDDEVFAKSILFFDEVDKIALSESNERRGNPMVNILQMFNGGSVAIEGVKSSENIDISRFTVLFGGAFDGLEGIIRERVQPKAKIGFSSECAGEKKSSAELMQSVTAADLKEYGLMPELLGRIGSILTIQPLELEDYRQLLNAESGSIRSKYHNYLSRLYGVTFRITDAATETIAQKCMAANTGARAVNPIVNDPMRAAISTVESDSTVNGVVLDAEGDSCCVRYEHGERGYSFRNPAREQEELPTVTIKAKNAPALVRKLCRYYRNAGGDFVFEPQLEAFLDCAITFLHRCVKPTEFTFDSLEKLARSVKRPAERNPKSPFDIVMGDARNVISFNQRHHFDSAYTPDMQTRLVSALELVAVYIEVKNQRGRVVFDVPRRKG